jgi:hypothetical protein
MRESVAKWKEYRQHRSRWLARNRSFGGVLPSLAALALLWTAGLRSGRPLDVLTVIALYASATALCRSATYCGRVVRGFDRAVLINLPIGDEDYLRHESRALFRSWAGAFSVFLMAYGGYALAYKQGSPFEYGALIGLDVVLILISLQPITIMGHFSAGTNDTKQMPWQNLLFFGMALIFLIVGLVAGFMIFITPTFLVHIVALAVIVGITTTSWAAYKLLFERGRIDLLSKPSGH